MRILSWKVITFVVEKDYNLDLTASMGFTRNINKKHISNLKLKTFILINIINSENVTLLKRIKIQFTYQI